MISVYLTGKQLNRCRHYFPTKKLNKAKHSKIFEEFHLGHAFLQKIGFPSAVLQLQQIKNTTNMNGSPSKTKSRDTRNKNSVVVKVGMVGDSQIGKTSLMVKYVEGSFDEDYIQTLGNG